MSCVIWITGLPGSGKTTLANSLVKNLLGEGKQSILLDGDQLRLVMNVEKGFDRLSRVELAKVYSRLARLIAVQGISAIVSTVSLFHEVHNYNRAIHDNYREVFLDVSFNLLEAGPRREMYLFDNSSYLQDITPEFPVRPDLHLKAEKEGDRKVWLSQLIVKANEWC